MPKGSRGGSKANSGGSRNGSRSAEKTLTLKEMIDKGMTPSEIRKYREEHGMATQKVNKVEGVKGNFTTYKDVADSSPNTIWANKNNPHAVLKNERGEIHIKGDKKDKFGMLETVNTAHVIMNDFPLDVNKWGKKETNKLNNYLKEIKYMDFDIPKISINSNQVDLYVKRRRFTKEW